MESNIERLLSQHEPVGLDYQPAFFRLSRKDECDSLAKLLNEKPFIKIYNYIDNQLTEFIKSQHPQRQLTKDDLTVLKQEHCGSMDLDGYGVWVYYPWHEKLVHILDESEFKTLRTNRNQFKITQEEQAILSTKKIGVIGLSVGQSVALALTMERCYGELRIADFDQLDLSNLNRIRTPLYNIGMPKAIVVAREIAEIDPFLKVIPFLDGITEENMPGFFTDGGPLDILVEECDSLDIKLKTRKMARTLGIPVVMDTSDRGMLDIERFDLDPSLPLFHGRIEEHQIPEGPIVDPQVRIALSAQIVGADTLSDKLKYSMQQIGKTISTWPQLATSVILGGAAAAQVCRKLALGEDVPSGRFYVDVDELLRHKS